MAGRQSHVGDVGRVPCRDDQAPAGGRGGIGLDRLDPRDQVCDLVDRLAIGCPPRTPLLAIDRTQLPLRVGPLVPDRDPVFLEIGDIRRAPKEPDQLVNDGAERQALGRDERESLAKVKSDLPAEDAEGVNLLSRRAQHGAGRLPHAVGADVAQQVEVLLHAEGCSNNRVEARSWTPEFEIISLRRGRFSGASESLLGRAVERGPVPARQAGAR